MSYWHKGIRSKIGSLRVVTGDLISLRLRSLGPHPADYGELVHVLRRGEVAPKLLLFVSDDARIADEWMQACEVEDRYVIEYTDQQSAGRFMDALEFSVSTMRGDERRGWRNCRTFDVYSMIDAHDSPATDLTVQDRVRAAVLAAAGYGLGKAGKELPGAPGRPCLPSASSSLTAPVCHCLPLSSCEDFHY